MTTTIVSLIRFTFFPWFLYFVSFLNFQQVCNMLKWRIFFPFLLRYSSRRAVCFVWLLLFVHVGRSAWTKQKTTYQVCYSHTLTSRTNDLISIADTSSPFAHLFTQSRITWISARQIFKKSATCDFTSSSCKNAQLEKKKKKKKKSKQVGKKDALEHKEQNRRKECKGRARPATIFSTTSVRAPTRPTASRTCSTCPICKTPTTAWPCSRRPSSAAIISTCTRCCSTTTTSSSGRSR